jgi:hypothetical protein
LQRLDRVLHEHDLARACRVRALIITKRPSVRMSYQPSALPLAGTGLPS